MSAICYVRGVFDLLHLGHMQLLAYAATFGPVYAHVVPDCYVTKPGRPILDEQLRLATLRFVLKLMHQPEPQFGGHEPSVDILLLRREHPHIIWCAGEEYQNCDYIRTIAKRHNVELAFYKNQVSIHTTAIVQACHAAVQYKPAL